MAAETLQLGRPRAGTSEAMHADATCIAWVQTKLELVGCALYVLPVLLVGGVC